MFCVCYTCDDNYAVQLGASMYSLYENNQDMPSLDAFLFSDAISDENLTRLRAIADRFQRELTIIDVQDITRTFRDSGKESKVDNGSLSIYVRLLIPDFLGDAYTTALYLDADTLVVGSLKELACTEIDEPLGAVVDIIHQMYKERIGVRGFYFNGGVLLFNVAEWKKRACREWVLAHLENAESKYLFSDQDVINLALQDEIATLPLKYNRFPFYGDATYASLMLFPGEENAYYPQPVFEEAKKNPVIVHLVYSVLDRPWYQNNLCPYTDLWQTYAKKAGWDGIVLKKRQLSSKERMKWLIYRLFGQDTVLRMQAKNRERYFKNYELAKAD